MIISHSEVDTYLLCQRRHRYAFGEHLQRKVMSQSLQRGIAGHSMMEAFWKEYMKSLDIDDALTDIDDTYALMISQGTITPDDLKLLNDLHVRIVQFLNYFRGEIINWRPEAVEKTFMVPLEQPWVPDLTFAFTPDLVIKLNGRLVVVDWKFPYNFYNPTAINLMPQLPKYISALRKLGYSVRGGIYGFVRYRSLKEATSAQLYKLHVHNPSKVAIEDTWRDYYQAALEIASFKSMPYEQWVQKAKRVGNNLVCNSCAFKELCAAEKEGSDGMRIRAEMFEPSTYGYVEVAE